MTAIEQSALGLPVVKHAKNGVSANGNHDTEKGGKNAKSFDDLMSEAEGKLGGLLSGVDADALVDDADGAADNSLGTDANSRIRISTNFHQALKNASAVSRGEATANTSQAEKIAAEKNGKNGKIADAGKAAEVTGNKEDSPAQQLSSLLGLLSNDEATESDASATPAAHKKAGSQVSDSADTKEGASSEKGSASTTIDILKDAAIHMHGAEAVHHSAAQSADAAEADDDAENSGGTVRLISKDGKGTPVDVPLADIAGADEKDTAGQSSGKTDFVTVLESRRYLGFSTDTNATTLANAIKADPSWSQALQSVTAAQNAIEGNTATTVNTLKLQMNPENLGSMTASLRLKGEELTVEVKVETVEAYRHLSNDHDTIVKALKDQGFNIDQVTIQLSASDKSSDVSQDRGNQSSNGQDARDSLGQNAKQREENERRTGNQNIWLNNEQASSQSDLGNSSGDDGSGNIYL